MRTASFLVAILLSVAATSSAQAVTYSAVADFESTGQSLWGTGESSALNIDTRLLGTSWNESAGGSTGFVNPHGDGIEGRWPRICAFGGCIGGNRYVITPSWDLGTWGASFEASTSGNIGLRMNASLDPGSVSVKYPVKAFFDLPSAPVQAGSTIRIGSAYEVTADARLDTASAHGTMKLVLDANAKAAVGGRICTGGCANPSTTLFDVKTTTDILSISTRDVGGNVSGSVTKDLPVGASAHIPKISTSGGAEGTLLASHGEDRFAEAHVNVSHIVSDAIGIPLNGRTTIAGVDVGYKTIDLALSAGLDLTQDFSFSATPFVRYALSSGQTIVGKLGDAIDFLMPQGVSAITVTPTVFLEDSAFTNKTRLMADLGLDLEMLAINLGIDIPKISVFGVGIVGGGELALNLDPLVDISERLPVGGGIGLFEDTWELAGFQAVTLAPFQIQAVPEASTWAMTFVGLAGLALLKRRKTGSFRAPHGTLTIVRW